MIDPTKPTLTDIMTMIILKFGKKFPPGEIAIKLTQDEVISVMNKGYKIEFRRIENGDCYLMVKKPTLN